jgi:hypothetical protein
MLPTAFHRSVATLRLPAMLGETGDLLAQRPRESCVRNSSSAGFMSTTF